MFGSDWAYSISDPRQLLVVVAVAAGGGVAGIEWLCMVSGASRLMYQAALFA